jgi:hypothetical protein
MDQRRSVVASLTQFDKIATKFGRSCDVQINHQIAQIRLQEERHGEKKVCMVGVGVEV